MSKLKNIIYLTQSDYTTLSNGGTVTKNGHTLTGIDEDSIYITTDQASIEDLTGILPVAHGGTGKNTLLSGQVLIGNGTSAITSKAIASTITNDSNTLPSTAAVYNSALLKSGGTMTGVLTVLGNQYADGYNGALNMNNSDIYGLNSIYTTDSADNAGEGIHFYRDSTHVDTLWINGGDILFVPNRALGTATTKANSEKVARLPASITASRAVYTDGTTGELAISSVTATELGYLDGVTSSIQTQLNNKAAANAKITIAGNDVSLGGNLSDSTLRESLGLSKALRFIGVTTTDMTGGTAANHSWTGTPAGISNYTPKQGDVVINSTKQDEWVCTSVSGTTYTWERLGSDTSYKIVQSAVADPTAATTTSTTFIDTISQNTNGVITATKKTLPTASSSVAGITKVGASGGAAAYSHTHSYLANTNKGAENRPIYITGNTATECEYMFPVYYKVLDFSSTAPVPGAYPINNETNPATNTTGWYGSALSLPGINASTKHYAAQVFIGSRSGADAPVHMYVRRLTSSPAWSGWTTILDNNNTEAANSNGADVSVSWNTSTKIATINDVDIKIKIPAKPTYTYSDVGAAPESTVSCTTANVQSALGINTSSGSTSKALTEKGTWATFGTSNLTIGTTSTTAMAGNTTVTNVAISANVTTDANYPIVFTTSNKDTTSAKNEGLQKSGTKFYFNPSTGNVVSTLFNNLTLTAATTGFTIAGGTTSKTLTVAGTVTINTPTQWGIVYGGASGAYTSTAAGTSGQYLKSNGNAAPTWATFSASTVGLSNVTNDAQIPKSIGTTKGDIIYFDGNASPKRLAIGTNGEVLKIVSGIPSWETDNNDDTKNTAGSTNSDSKLYLIGAASQAANPQTYSDAHVFETNGAFSAKTLGVNADTDDDKVTLQWNSTDNSLDFVFA